MIAIRKMLSVFSRLRIVVVISALQSIDLSTPISDEFSWRQLCHGYAVVVMATAENALRKCEIVDESIHSLKLEMHV